MDVLILIGRILFAALFLPAAVNHFVNADAMAGYTQAQGVPAARAGVLGSGVLLLLGGLSVLLGIWPDLGALLLAVFLVPTALLMHAFWKEADPQTKQLQQVQFSKNIALTGASLMLIGLFAIAGDELGLVITGPLFAS